MKHVLSTKYMFMIYFLLFIGCGKNNDVEKIFYIGSDPWDMFSFIELWQQIGEQSIVKSISSHNDPIIILNISHTRCIAYIYDPKFPEGYSAPYQDNIIIFSTTETSSHGYHAYIIQRINVLNITQDLQKPSLHDIKVYNISGKLRDPIDIREAIQLIKKEYMLYFSSLHLLVTSTGGVTKDNTKEKGNFFIHYVHLGDFVIYMIVHKHIGKIIFRGHSICMGGGKMVHPTTEHLIFQKYFPPSH